MAYYNRNSEIFKNKKMDYLSSGQCASVCHNNEIIFKEYFSDTLENCRLNVLLFDIFTDNSIITDDVKRGNAILSNDSIIIIDPDTFYISSLPKLDIAIENKKELLVLFRSICVSGIRKIKNRETVIQKIILDLADIDIDCKTNITNEIYKKLKYVKRPIDYLIK